MKVKELISELQKYDEDAEIEFPLHTYTKVFPSVYVQDDPMFSKEPTQNYADGYRAKVRITIHLPQGFSISERKSI